MAKLPNLELLEYKAWQYFFAGEENKRKYKQLVKHNRRQNMIATVFLQTWGSTCLGFDVMEDGSPAIGGDAMTEAYTTVFYEPLTETYLVFFGDECCYQVTTANETFLNDLKNHRLESLSEAKKEY